MMITHNIAQALETGNRTLMMENGQILFDIQGDMRSRMTVDQLLGMYSSSTNRVFDNDRMLFGTQA